MTTPIIRSAYGPKAVVKTAVGKKTMTKQSFAEECDINNIMAKYQKTGLIDHYNRNAPQYGFATSHDFRESLELVKKAQDMFDELPSQIRRKFDESPQKVLAFCEDPNNRSEMAVLGLLNEEATSALEAEKKASDSASAPIPTTPVEAPTSE